MCSHRPESVPGTAGIPRGALKPAVAETPTQPASCLLPAWHRGHQEAALATGLLGRAPGLLNLSFLIWKIRKPQSVGGCVTKIIPMNSTCPSFALSCTSLSFFFFWQWCPFTQDTLCCQCPAGASSPALVQTLTDRGAGRGFGDHLSQPHSVAGETEVWSSHRTWLPARVSQAWERHACVCCTSLSLSAPCSVCVRGSKSPSVFSNKRK